MTPYVHTGTQSVGKSRATLGSVGKEKSIAVKEEKELLLRSNEVKTQKP